MIKGALFDMDGVLVDSTPAHVEAFALFCERYNVSGWEQRLAACYGMGNDDIMREILPAELVAERGIVALSFEKEAIYREIYAPRVIPVEGLKELLDGLHKSGIRIAVGSSGCADNVNMVLERCSIAQYFDFVVNGDCVTRCKPDPEIYLTASAGLGLKPSECIIFEDAPAGLESARRAGAGKIIALATTFARERLETEVGVECIIENFTQITDLNYLLR